MNERMRVYVRLEQLFRRIDHAINGHSNYDMQTAVMLIIDLYAINSRTDVKRDLLKDLDRQGQLGVEHGQEVDGLHTMRGQANGHLKNNEFLNLIRQRSAASSFLSTSDLFAFDHWLKQPVEEMRAVMHEWLHPYEPFRAAIVSLLEATRNSGQSRALTAVEGFYHSSLDANIQPTLLRISLCGHPHIYPEISAGKLRVSLRFMNFDDPNSRGYQIDNDIDFELQTCTA